ncbi:Glucan synthesis regulatory protein [Cladobotryum mycophilum]|uniref:Glucan synthesis regulatory protein n=1 Tax=Cladobotryum mycophilum TaxID=491253 RepID=A0ABR0SN28_9HYPO
MANMFSSTIRDFWHTMTSNDRHSSFDSPYRTGRHVPLQNGRNGMLTGVATASDSRHDVSAPYFDETGRSSSSNGGSPKRSATNVSYSPTTGPARPYSPGLRSMSAQNTNRDGFEVQTGDVPMQPFENGLPPPPPVQHSWRRIDAWAEENYPELFDQLCEGATNNDLNDVEHQLDCSLPQDVRDSMMVHDGQERGGNPTGIIFGSICRGKGIYSFQISRGKQRGFLFQAATIFVLVVERTGRMETESPCQAGLHPPNTVQKAYAHAGWIPLVRDWGGNNLAVDLAPGPAGRYGQIIMFGRDYDTKYVVARSWSAFLALVADDLNSGKWFVDEDTNELKLREFKEARVEPSYFNILRWRMDQKYGRRAARRRSQGPSKNGSPLGSRSASPYTSPVDGDVRGRSMQRLSGSSPLTSPMRHGGHGKMPLLSRVTEEAAIPELADAMIEPSNLVDVDDDLDSPRGSVDGHRPKLSLLDRSETDLLKDKGKEIEVPKANGKQPEVTDGAMKTIEI